MGNLLDFSGKTVVLTGGASGIGAATAALALDRGAEVHVLDIAAQPGTGSARWVRCDLGDPMSIDDAVAALPSHIDALLNCAGVPNGGRFTPSEIMAINWLGLRHLTEAALDRLADGGAVVNVASTAGRDWPARADAHAALMAATDFDAGLAWVKSNGDLVGDGYAFSKEAVQYYTQWRAVQLLPTGVRMNSVCPGVTDTAIVADFRRGLGDAIIDHAAAVAGRMADPSEMAPALLFLADPVAASYVNGVNLNVDRGTGAARNTGQSDPKLIWGQ